MFAIKIRYLMGRSYSAPPEAGDEKNSSEWPPHPGRFYCALVAAWGESGKSPEGKAALEWLECLDPPPHLIFPEESQRVITKVYVPANDIDLPKKETKEWQTSLAHIMPETRLRNERRFPSVSLASDSVWFIWPGAAISPEHHQTLAEIFRHTTSLGHSASMVEISFDDAPPTDPVPEAYSLLVPDPAGMQRLRVPAAGRLSYLEEQYKKFTQRPTKTNRPSPGPTTHYRLEGSKPKKKTKHGAFLEMVVVRKSGGTTMGLLSTHQLMAALRGSILTHAPQPVPEFISGHAPGSTSEKPVRSERPHVALVPLANIGHHHADGKLLGAGILIPELTTEERTLLLATISQVITHPLNMATAGSWTVASVDATERRESLQPRRWLRPARLWATVTPFVFDRFPKDRHGEEAKEIVRQACRFAGLPGPSEVVCAQKQYALPGVPPSAAFNPAPPRPGKPRRCHIHLLLAFDEEVPGPVSIGAGRYYGYGFCAPLET
jgi:CRISPR-associated protein Csb2